jgi:hypothetical protein
VERDLPFYDPTIAEQAVSIMNRFAHSLGLLAVPATYEDTVAASFRHLWRSPNERR